MKVLLTGISECNKSEFIKETVDLARKNGEKVKYISMGDLLMKQLKSDLGATFIPENVLNIDEEFRALAIKNIIREIKEESKKNKHIIISGHATFYWKKNFSNAFNWEYLKELAPDLIVTLIHNSEAIKANMEKSPQWKEQEMAIDEILSWQGVEVNTTSGWSQILKKPHFVLPRNESKGLLYKLMFKPKAELIYASFPMSNIKSDSDRKRIDDFIQKLEKYFAVINPRSIELAKTFNQTEAAQTVQRDLRWFTGKAKKIIVFYLPNLVFSAGVLTEINHAFETTKEVWMISPKAYYGPFEKHMISKRFNSEEEFFAFLEKKGYKDLGIKF
ncbi:AAA family ATPase [Candidatus Woesearchaeota archaeon]|nr:AAA family ATPase [Candidatus Woesearchaeota archaeon]